MDQFPSFVLACDFFTRRVFSTLCEHWKKNISKGHQQLDQNVSGCGKTRASVTVVHHNGHGLTATAFDHLALLVYHLPPLPHPLSTVRCALRVTMMHHH